MAKLKLSRDDVFFEIHLRVHDDLMLLIYGFSTHALVKSSTTTHRAMDLTYIRHVAQISCQLARRQA